MKKSILLCFVLAFCSCNSIKLRHDYDKNTDFSGYATYSYFLDINPGLSVLDTKRLFEQLDIALKAKGLLYSDEPDFYINISSKYFQEGTRNTVGVGVGSSGNSVGGGVNIGIPLGQPSVKREITFDFVDTNKDLLFWQAVTTDKFKEATTPEGREQQLAKLVLKMLEKYPPK